MKKKIFVIIGMILVGAGILSLNLKCTHVIKANTISQQASDVLFPNEVIDEDQNNLYIELNNKLVEAITKYENEEISEKEYINICNEIKYKINSQVEVNQLESDEKEYQEYENEKTSTDALVRSGSYTDVLNRLTSEEIKLYSSHPIKAAKAKSCADQAESSASNKYKAYTLWQGNGDAYRHAYWSALMTKKIDRNFAYDVGLAHEGLKSGYNFDKQNADTKMDISNNYSGRKIGTSNSSKSDSTISSVVKSNCSNGKLKRIRTYTSSVAKNDKIINGVMTNYVGYYVATTSGGLK